jgi:hypothetical protein
MPPLFDEGKIIFLTARAGETPVIDTLPTTYSQVENWIAKSLDFASSDGMPKISQS